MAELLAQATAARLPDIEWSLLWPFLVPALGSILLITLTSLFPALRTRGFPAVYTVVVAIVAGGALVWAFDRLSDPNRGELVVGGAIAIDHFTLFVTATILIGVAATALVLRDYLVREGFDGPEWYALVLLSASGGIMLASANDLIVAFLGLEILSISVYVLAALHLRRIQSQEAGFKYFILGALSSAIFLYGIAMLYGATGSLSYNRIAEVLGDGVYGMVNDAGLAPGREASLLLAGIGLLLVGFAFKVSAAPFHFWTPDVYQGAPSPVVGFMASAVKVAGFGGLLRLFVHALGDRAADWQPMIAALALISIILGSIMAIIQTDVKRMLAYSSISHAGFMLLALHAAGSSDAEVAANGAQAALFYMLAYALMVLGTFAIVTAVGRRGDGAHSLTSYRGLSKEQPVLAALMMVLLFSQAGVPFTAGFFGKFTVILAAADGRYYVLAGVAMLASVIGAYLYLRIVVAMFLSADDSGEAHADTSAPADENDDGAESLEAEAAPELGPIVVPRLLLLTATAAAVITIVLGIFPGLIESPLVKAAAALLS